MKRLLQPAASQPVRSCLGWLAFVIFLWLTSTPSTVVWAAVERFEIIERGAFADGMAFGEVGAYERIRGRIHFRIDPTADANRGIVDLDLAQQDDAGRVAFSADLFILSPQDLTKGNGAILYDVNNRGNKLALRFFNDGSGGNNPKQAGNGFLMRRGFTIVWSGWDGELVAGNSRLRLDAPVAHGQQQPISGRVRYEIVTSEENRTRLAINGSGHGAYRPTEQGIKEATLTWRLRSSDQRVWIPAEQFRLLVERDAGSSPTSLPKVELDLPAGFRPGYLYELIYEAQDPLVHGVCFASVRDLISALKHGWGDSNPLKMDESLPLSRAYGFGVSQSGRFLREMLYSGFNYDEQGKIVFDGLMPHVAGGGLGSFNHRFAQPTAFATQHEKHDWHTDRFPFAYGVQIDPLSGKRDGILQRSLGEKTQARVIHTQSSTEYWSRSGSLVHTDPQGTRDAELPENVRIFAFGGTQHGPSSFPPRPKGFQSLANPGDYRPLLRACLVALDQWCRDGVPAPASVMPTIEEGTLVDWQQASTGFPAIPAIRYPVVIQQPSLLNLGSLWEQQRIISRLPPEKIASYKVLVAKCGADGNELGCLLPPEVAVPLATFAGWNLRTRQLGPEGELVGLVGSYIPLPITTADRRATGDPRRSIQQRYGTLEKYLQELSEECGRLVHQRYLLEEEVEPILARQKKRAAALFEQMRK